MKKINKKIIIGNWKMNPQNTKEAEKLFKNIISSLNDIKKTETVICPPYLYLPYILKIFQNQKKYRKVFLGSQNAFMGNTGTFTGEVSVGMLYNIGIKYVILGHSERRNFIDIGEAGESNNIINQKIKYVFSYGLIPIFCIGEKIRDEKHEYLEFIKEQLEEGLDKIPKNLISKLIIAYEPIWAIGKNSQRPATAEEFLEIKIFIKKVLSDKFGIKNINGLRIIYGGSVYEDDIIKFLKVGEADGFLLGRNSLDVEKFIKIINITEDENS